MEWVLERLPILIFVLVFVGQIVRAVMKSRDSRIPREEQHEPVDEEQRVKEIQEQIRRRIAERRSGQPGTAEPPPLERGGHPPPPVLRRIETTQLPEPFGGPLRRMLEELEGKAQRLPVPPVVAERRNLELERQERLAEEMKSLEEARALARRRAAQLAAAKEVQAQSLAGLRSASRARMLEELRDPQSLRRAFVLREVLGPPVGLR